MKICDDNSKRLDLFSKENAELRKEVNKLQVQVMTMMGSLCYDITCKSRMLSETVNPCTHFYKEKLTEQELNDLRK